MKICPRCGSRNVDWILPQNQSIWECKDCDYTGPIIEGNAELAKEIRESYETKLKKEKIKKNKSSENKEKEEVEEELEEDLSDEEINRRLDELNI
ncbi:hypothetical protein KQY27_05550 [Methanobrevibacter sp. TMH8]|uniref:hypothetical protein n=1 Tax=Methanobrevibacter sp. TMH8 TaxID=2848611 RepID=UPI001CC999BA|nr:hypothetical protein [Methanobrevibacter sp. TMH8]MBZ9571001.1 hypothetical protein [Methanobrevibacter sp. TMH8]